MRFQTELVSGVLIRRYKRFLADVLLPDGREVVVHCPNPGSMLGMAEAGMRVWVEPNSDPRKKLDYGWRLVEVGGATVVVDTGIANRVVGEALRAGLIEGLQGEVRAEVPYGANSRADFLVESAAGRIWVEVKSVTLSRAPGLAEFPDTKTARGAKHLGELAARVAAGDGAVLLYLVGRDDCDRMTVAGDIDPAYAAAADAARAAGVAFRVYGVEVGPQGVEFVPAPLALM
ncbi:DNA/RNA nuclease SfsA [Celeribacter arenosi]|uniref:Sugar fermentation stimulation protein homolog n=1 Tax=Celeribacter arenosi TaxID=792649 RepID=A0ABP7K1L2_9RHOB